MSFNSYNIADTVLAISRMRGDSITNLKLQKLMYYAQAWNLVFTGKPLFLESIEAWVHGPVVPSIFRRFKDYRWSPIDCPVEPCEDEAVRGHIESVIDAYGKFTATELERITHHETPWIEARRGLDPDVPSCNVISHSAMRDYYGKDVVAVNG
jgi:uncharacterized phage-associated protein